MMKSWRRFERTTIYKFQFFIVFVGDPFRFERTCACLSNNDENKMFRHEIQLNSVFLKIFFFWFVDSLNKSIIQTEKIILFNILFQQVDRQYGMNEEIIIVVFFQPVRNATESTSRNFACKTIYPYYSHLNCSLIKVLIR